MSDRRACGVPQSLEQAAAATKSLRLGVSLLARSLGVPATPTAVAAAYSRDELPAFRKSMSDGCLRALQGKPLVQQSAP